MKIDLIARGAPELPENFRYRVHVYEVYESAVDVNVSILEKTKHRLFKVIPYTRERVVASSTVRIPRNAEYNAASRKPIVSEAKILYDYAKSRGRL